MQHALLSEESVSWAAATLLSRSFSLDEDVLQLASRGQVRREGRQAGRGAFEGRRRAGELTAGREGCI